MPIKPEILKQTTLCRSRLFHVQSVDLRFANGHLCTHERLLSGSQPPVLVVPMLDQEQVLMVREYGVGLDNYQLVLPKGRAEPGETAEQAADRELKEEAGYGAKRLTLLKCMSQSPSYQQHLTQIVLAQDLYPEKLEGDEPEPLEVVPMPLNELSQWIGRADLTEARTIAALYLARDYLAEARSAQ